MPTPSRERGNELDGLISVAQAAALLGVHPNTLRAWTDAGRLTAYRINARGDRRYRRGDVERLLAEGGDPPDYPEPYDGSPSRRDVEGAVFRRLAQGSGPSATPAAVCRGAIEVLRTSLGVARAAIYLVHEARGTSLLLETHAGYQSPPPATLEASFIDAGVVNVRGDGTRAQLSLRAAGERIGELILEDEAGGPLTGRSDSFLRNVAGAIATDILNAKVLGQARREVSRSRALRHVTQELTGQLDLAAVLDDIVDRTRSLFDAEKAGLWLLDESNHPFSRAASRGLGDEFHSRVHGLTLADAAVGVRAVRERRTAVVREADTRGGVGAMQGMYAAEGIKTVCLVPLVINNRAVGLLGLYHARDHEWPEDELALAQSFANQAAVAISNARLYRSVADQAARIRSIQDLSARLNRLTDVQAIADAIVAEASALAGYHDIRVYTVEWERGVCEPVAFTDRLLGDGDFKEALRVDIGPGSFTGWVAEHGEPILANDALNDPRGLTIDGTDDIEESMLVVPMLFEGRSVGVIALSKLGNNQFSNDDLQTMTIFAGYAAQAMANAGAYERLELQSAELARQLQSQRRLLEINERLLSTLDRADVLETIADGLQAVVVYDNLSIYGVDEGQRVLVPVLTRERHEEEVRRYVVPFGQGLMGWAVEHGEPVLANDALTDERAKQIPGTPNDPEALVVVPLMAEGDVIGCMNISRVGGPEVYFSDADFELVKLFAGQASIALRNADAHQAIAMRAETDALTGLGNHGAFQRTLSEVLGQPEAGTEADRRRAAPPTGPLALLMMDLDNFKAYNDRLGHPAGDALLHAVGAAIYGSARGEDRVFRYGGDEFAVLLPDVDAHGAEAIGDRVRQAVARLTAKEAAPVTITVGVAAYPEDAVDKNDLIAAADIALYLGKQAGEDRVVRADEVPHEMRDLRSTLDRLARAALLHPDDAPTVDSLVEQATLLSHATEHGQDTVRDALLGVARSLDALDPAAIGHGERVGRLAGLIARKLGCDEGTADTVELAARLQSLQGVGADELEPIPSLREVGEIVRWHRTGGPLEQTPLGAQVLVAANGYDTLVASPDGTQADRRSAIDELAAAAGQRYSPAVVRALAAVIGVKPRIPRRRRTSDDEPGVRGAA